MSDEPKIEAEKRADELLQYFFEELITEEEVGELLGLFDRHPELEAQGRLNYQVDRLFRFRGDLRRSLSPDRLNELSAAFRRTRRFDDLPEATEGTRLDMDELARRAVDAAEEATTLQAKSLKRPEKMSTFGKPNRSLLPLWLVVPLMLIVFGIMVFQEWKPVDRSTLDTASRPKNPAVVVDTAGVRWSEGTTPPRLGEPLLPGSLCFESGTVELLFYNGVRGIVEGPAELLLIDEKQVFCKQGRWSVTVPPLGKGFEIQTPHLTVRDLGTRFHASIERDLCNLHVLEGVVETEKSDGGKTVLKTDQAGSFQGSDLVERMAAAVDRFVTKSEMRRRADKFLFTGKNRAVVEKQIDRDVICVVDTTEIGENDGRFVHAELFGGTPTEGRRPDVPAIGFTRSEDRIRLKTSGKVQSLTALFWIRIDRLNSNLNPILMSEGVDRGGLTWHLSAQGAFSVGVRNRASRGSEAFLTPSVYTDERLGQWTHLALSIDGPSRQIAVYVDGDIIFSKQLSRLVPLDLSGLDVGNWKPRRGQSENASQLDAAFDRIVLFDRALTLNEIRILYEREKETP